MKALYIEWIDSSSYTGNMWVPRDVVAGNNKPHKCKTIGFVLVEDEENVTLVGSFDSNNNGVSGDITIPKCAITKRRIVTWKP